MSDASPVAPAPRPLRIWPAVALTLAYWISQVITDQLEMPMFSRFMSGVVTKGLFLLTFLILWFTNGTVRGRLRLLGLPLLLGGVALGIALSDKSFQAFGFIMATVPIALTTWTIWMVAGRFRPALVGAAPLAAVLLLTFCYFDLWRWDGLDGHLGSSSSLRWSKTAEQEFLAAKAVTAPPSAPSAAATTWTLRPDDVPEFRGLQRDGVVRGVTFASNWKDAPPEQVWKQRVGPGWSSLILVDGNLVTQEQRGENEAVVCYAADTGKELWSAEEPARFTEPLAGVGPRATPTFKDGRLYALGAAGRLACLEAPTGKKVWSRELAKSGDGPLPMWGYSASPLVVDGKVIVFIGGAKGQGVLAFDASTGAPAWSREVGKESYSSAQALSIGGKPQVVMQDNKKIVGLSIADGSLLWEHPGENESLIPMLQPHALTDGSMLVSFGGGVILLAVREDSGKWVVEQKWNSKRLKPSFNDFVIHDGYVYGLDDGVLCCVDLKNGERIWKKGRYGGGQLLLLADAKLLLVLSEKGELALVPAEPKVPEEAVLFPAIEGKTWNHPTVAKDRIYVRNGNEMACFRVKSP
jgi:outer membrane protein assembly factor BamB